MVPLNPNPFGEDRKSRARTFLANLNVDVHNARPVWAAGVMVAAFILAVIILSLLSGGGSGGDGGG